MDKLITSLEPTQRFVFGSNLAGRHGAGAALQARRHFGAEYGIGEGLTGKCYAFPSLGHNLEQRSENELSLSVQSLYETCRENPALEFLLTRVSFMRSLFTDPPANLILPEDWR